MEGKSAKPWNIPIYREWVQDKTSKTVGSLRLASLCSVDFLTETKSVLSLSLQVCASASPHIVCTSASLIPPTSTVRGNEKKELGESNDLMHGVSEFSSSLHFLKDIFGQICIRTDRFVRSIDNAK